MSDKGCHTVPSMHGDEGLQGDEDKGAEDIPGTDAIFHIASMMFNRLNIKHRLHRIDGGQQVDNMHQCFFHPHVQNKKSVHSLLSTSPQQQDGAAFVQMGLSPWLLPICYCCLISTRKMVLWGA